MNVNPRKDPTVTTQPTSIQYEHAHHPGTRNPLYLHVCGYVQDIPDPAPGCIGKVAVCDSNDCNNPDPEDWRAVYIAVPTEAVTR